jgi:hypothetical protein
MRLENIKAALAVGWVAVTCSAAFAAGGGTASGWTLLAIAMCLPPLAMWWLWNEPHQTLSQSIDQARR